MKQPKANVQERNTFYTCRLVGWTTILSPGLLWTRPFPLLKEGDCLPLLGHWHNVWLLIGRHVSGIEEVCRFQSSSCTTVSPKPPDSGWESPLSWLAVFHSLSISLPVFASAATEATRCVCNFLLPPGSHKPNIPGRNPPTAWWSADVCSLCHFLLKRQRAQHFRWTVFCVSVQLPELRSQQAKGQHSLHPFTVNQVLIIWQSVWLAKSTNKISENTRVSNKKKRWDVPFVI